MNILNGVPSVSDLSISRRTIRDQVKDMPELPEVEIVRRGLEPVLIGNSITACHLYAPALRYPFGDDFVPCWPGAPLWRRGGAVNIY